MLHFSHNSVTLPVISVDPCALYLCISLEAILLSRDMESIAR